MVQGRASINNHGLLSHNKKQAHDLKYNKVNAIDGIIQWMKDYTIVRYHILLEPSGILSFVVSYNCHCTESVTTNLNLDEEEGGKMDDHQVHCEASDTKNDISTPRNVYMRKNMTMSLQVN